MYDLEGSNDVDPLVCVQKNLRKTDIQTVLHVNSPPYRKSVYAPQQNRTRKERG